MSTCLYTHAYIYIYIYIYMYIRTGVYTRTYMYIRRTCTHARIRGGIHTCPHACMHTYIHVYTRRQEDMTDIKFSPDGRCVVCTRSCTCACMLTHIICTHQCSSWTVRYMYMHVFGFIHSCMQS